MRKRFIFITLVCILIILFTSCPLQKNFDDQPSLFKGSTISICIPFVSENNTVSRTAIPSYSENFPVSQYIIIATKADQNPVTFSIQNISSAEVQETKLNLVIAGVWELSIQGKNAEGTVVCKGNGTIEVSKAPYYEGRATVVLYPLTETGKGTLDLEVTMPDNTEVVISKVTLKNKTTDAKYTKTYDSTSFTISELDNEAEESVADFSSGVYDLQLELFSSTDMNKDDILYRKSEIVYVWTGFITNKWIDHYSYASGSTVSAAVNSILNIPLSYIAKTDTSFSSLEITEVGTSSYEPGDFVATTMRYTCADVPLTLSIKVDEAQGVVIANAKKETLEPKKITKQSDESYILGFDLPKYTENDYVNIEVTATNGIKKESYSLVYGAVYISNEGNDSEGNGTKSNPYNTIAQAFNSLPEKEDSDNTIILLTDLEDVNPFNIANGGNMKITSVGGDKTYTGQIKVEEKGNLTLQNIRVEGRIEISAGATVILENGAVVKGTGSVIGDNVVFLAKDAYLTVAENYELPSGFTYGACITTEDGNDIVNTPVLKTETGVITNTLCNKFVLGNAPTEANNDGISTLYCIQANEDSTFGVIKKIGGDPSFDFSVNYSLAATKTTISTGSTDSTDRAVSIEIKDKNDVPITPSSATITLYQNGNSFAVLGDGVGTATTQNGVPEITIPTWFPAGNYQLYVEATIESKVYSGTCNLTITN